MKTQNSHRQEELKIERNNSKNKGVKWLHHMCFWMMDLVTTDASYREEAYVKVWWNQAVGCLKYKELGFYVMGIVKSLT